MSNKDSPAMIPPTEAAKLCEQYGYDQVVIIARRIGGEGYEAITTFGIDKANSEAAFLIGEHLKYKVMKWSRRGGN